MLARGPEPATAVPMPESLAELIGRHVVALPDATRMCLAAAAALRRPSLRDLRELGVADSLDDAERAGSGSGRGPRGDVRPPAVRGGRLRRPGHRRADAAARPAGRHRHRGRGARPAPRARRGRAGRGGRRGPRRGPRQRASPRGRGGGGRRVPTRAAGHASGQPTPLGPPHAVRPPAVPRGRDRARPAGTDRGGRVGHQPARPGPGAPRTRPGAQRHRGHPAGDPARTGGPRTRRRRPRTAGRHPHGPRHVQLRRLDGARWNHARIACELLEQVHPPDPIRMADALTALLGPLFYSGGGADLAVCRRAIELQGNDMSLPVSDRAMSVLFYLQMWTDEMAAARAQMDVAMRQCLEEGDEPSRCYVLSCRAHLEVRTGLWVEAERLLDEGIDLSRHIAEPAPRHDDDAASARTSPPCAAIWAAASAPRPRTSNAASPSATSCSNSAAEGCAGSAAWSRTTSTARSTISTATTSCSAR